MPSSSESGPAPAQSRAGQGLFGSALPSAQLQASSATISDAPPPYPPSLNPVPTLFGGSTAPALYQNGEGTLLAKLEKDITHTATAKVFLSSQREVHHVLIATIPLNASFTRVAVPTVDARIFYTCEVTNNSNYILTSGPIHTYLDGSHVSDSEIKNMAQPQTIQCSLGVHPEVTTEIERRIIDTETGFLSGCVTMYNPVYFN
ncbi:hypothetical protein K503DRAFT_804140 [Rhizopogon vinicolor AM-OR11-026]|uniref:Uncharacterized protein n=1 Tax=Rhizopogon vinicolor AM-OR11-026 TaxID=1314800 RepID=A0A1B7MM96_9AGAM|nr:hypothetical protein K503DRAFT_804140 [Rhizopogon vinicolor AM-OR11-026]